MWRMFPSVGSGAGTAGRQAGGNKGVNSVVRSVVKLGIGGEQGERRCLLIGVVIP